MRLTSPLLLAGAAVLGIPALLAAQNERNWVGTTSNNFATTTNWVEGAAPGTTTNPTTGTNTDIAIFSGTAQAGGITLGSSRNLGSIRYVGPNVASYELGFGGTNRFNLTVGGGVELNASVANPQTMLRMGITGAGGTLTLRNDASLDTATFKVTTSIISYSTGPTTLLLTGANTGANEIRNLTVNTGAGAVSVTKEGAGRWDIADGSVYGGGTTLNAGTLGIRSSGALSTGPLTINGGALGGLVTTRNLANAVTVNADFTLGGLGASLNFTGTVDLGGAVRTINLQNSNTFGGVVSNGGLVLSGDSTRALTLGAANTFSGGLQVNGSGVSVTHAGGLGLGDVALVSGSLALFDSAAASASLGNAADFVMSGGIWQVSVGTAHDALVGSGGGTFTISGGELALDITGAGFDYALTYPILQGFAGGTVSGVTFTGYDSALYAASLGTDGVLAFTAVPEPAVVGALASLAALGLAARRRRRG